MCGYERTREVPIYNFQWQVARHVAWVRHLNLIHWDSYVQIIVFYVFRLVRETAKAGFHITHALFSGLFCIQTDWIYQQKKEKDNGFFFLNRRDTLLLIV